MNETIFVGQVWRVTDAPAYQRDSWTLYFCTSGSGIFVFDGSMLHYQAGQLVVIPPDIRHTHRDDGGASCLYIFCKNAALALRHPALIADDAQHCIRHLFEDVLHLFGSGETQDKTLLSPYVQLIAQHINARRPAAPHSQLVEDIARNIVQNYTNPNYELDELLKSAPYCYDYLCRLFRQELNTTPHKYLTDLRLQSAADILRAGNGGSVSEVARLCGYSDPLYFSRMFKKKYGASPREYAKGR